MADAANIYDLPSYDMEEIEQMQILQHERIAPVIDPGRPLMLAFPTLAMAIDTESINTVDLSNIPIEAPVTKPAEADTVIVRLQVLLGRAGA